MLKSNCIKVKNFDSKHILCLLITTCFILISVFCFRQSFIRLVLSLKDLGLSFGFFFCETFGIEHSIVPSINDTSYINMGSLLPVSFDLFKMKMSNFGQSFISIDNFLDYSNSLKPIFFVFVVIISIVLPALIVLLLLIKIVMKKKNNDCNVDSKPLVLWTKISFRVCLPIKETLSSLFGFIKEDKLYYKLWLFIACISLNFLSIIVSFIAYYFYLVATFSFSTIYLQFYKLFADLLVLVKIPVVVWIAFALVAFDRFRKKIGYIRLNHFEMTNRGFINSLPIVVMVCGTMGKKKTTAITDMALSQDVMFRDKAFEKILENDLKFPNFPWINFENSLKKAMSKHSVYNLATCRRFVVSKHKKFLKRPLKYYCFGYDYTAHGTKYNDALKVVDLWEVLETYAQLYFIYVVESSLIISNYSIRTDNVLTDVGNFPLWNSDFFRSDSRLADSYSRHSHILDFDSLRLGRKLVEQNSNADNFEFGVVNITEVGKERKNTLELRDIKKGEDGTNQKNDGFNDWLKMVRHSATVDNFPFVRVIADEQRPESWGADARDLCEIIHIRESEETCLAMPFFSFVELLHCYIFAKFSAFYYKYRYLRSDNTLLLHFVKAVMTKLHNHYVRIYNTFGYSKLCVQVESGTQDGEIAEKKYFLMSKKIYSKRFSTDCFSDFFAMKSLRSPAGINDLKEYSTERANFGELKKQNSYFINDLLKGFCEDKTKGKQ